MGSTVRKLTVNIEAVEEGKLRGQKIVRAKARGKTVLFDYIGELFPLNVGDKIVIEFYINKPRDLSKFIFCGNGYVASKPGDPFTIFSVWGLVFRFEPGIDLDTNTKYYICLRKAK
jgi:DNA-directed RNA polymerase subunit G